MTSPTIANIPITYNKEPLIFVIFSSFAITLLDEIATGEFIYLSDNQQGNVYIPFEVPVLINDDQRYLFCITHYGENLYVGVCWSKDKGTGKKLGNSGFVAILDKDNKVISCPGGNEPKYVDGKIQPMFQTTKTFLHVHDLCVDKEGNIFVAQWNAKGAYPIKLELQK